MANTGPDTNTSHFSIMLGPAPHLNGHYTIFGEAVDGLEVSLQESFLNEPARVAAAGQLHI